MKRGQKEKMEIRKANKGDIKELIELMQKADNRTREWTEERTKRFVLKNKSKIIILCAEDGENLIEFIGLKEYEDNSAREFTDLTKFAWITWMAVLPEYRNKQIGTDLLKSAEEYVNNYNKQGLILDCREKVINFYKKNGYDIIGSYIDNKVSRYVLVKELK